MIDERLHEEAVLRIGEVTAVTGRQIFVAVDSEKNLSELFYRGQLIRNIAVGSYIDIRKGFLSLIGRVDGETSRADLLQDAPLKLSLNNKRVLSIVLVGYLDSDGIFTGGTRELPLIGNEAFLLTRRKVYQVHNLVRSGDVAIDIASSELEGYDVALPVDGLMNSHIAIFGNTGSGKSNTLAAMFHSFISGMRARNEAAFNARCQILIFDFNGEFVGPRCIATDKTIYNLSTRIDGDKIPLAQNELLDIEMLSILSDATEKTQKPFLKRALRLHDKIFSSQDPINYMKNILRQQIQQVLKMSDKVRVDLLIDYFRQVLPESNANGDNIELAEGLEWHNQSAEFKFQGNFLKAHPEFIQRTPFYNHVDNFNFQNDLISDFVVVGYVQLIYDILSNRAQNEHIAPAINKLRSKQSDIRKIFDPAQVGSIFKSNVVVVNLHDVNLEMKKTIPLLIAKRAYQEHKAQNANSTLNIVIDEAHNILSSESFREAESWKDYRLETFEEIVKEGRKFGVFVTIASQRPNDISQTITSQAHNYFIHRLVNQKDLQTISNAVSYIDKLTEESIPTLPVGTCIFSGVAGQMPLKLAVKRLPDELRPHSATKAFCDLVTPP